MSTTSAEEQQRPGGTIVTESEGARHEHERAVYRDDEYAERHVYVPHKVGLPPLGHYLKLVWQRREFAFELSRTTMRAKHFDTAFGQLWLLLNPLLLGGVYFLLVDLIRHHPRPIGFFAHLLGGLFLYQVVQTAANEGSNSVVRGGGLILNTAFPRSLLPLASVTTSFKRFVPTMAVYFVIHFAAGKGLSWEMLWGFPIVAMVTVFATGVAMFCAAAEVYFRDLSSFLPYLLRIWMYISPVLYTWEEVPKSYRHWLELNPLASMLASWSDVLNKGIAPQPSLMLIGLAWSIFAIVFGSLFFISRERDFAVRI
ncbi:MAG TPA: ABC transporter permease [Thermoleophilaceae bacterium]|nr:ABC transporter permease [Thermoleophilaceae bacterium]